jgi:hypothetical protein
MYRQRAPNDCLSTTDYENDVDYIYSVMYIYEVVTYIYMLRRHVTYRSAGYITGWFG